MSIMKRGNNYHLRKRVPRRYQDVEERKSVWVSLHTDSFSVAQQKADAAWQHIVEGWEARLAGDTSDAEKRFEAAKKLAAVRGFRYLPVERVAELPQEELLARVEAVQERKDGRPDMHDANAIMGGVSSPPLTVTRALELYWDLVKDKTLGKSPDQLRRWENPRKKAVKNFVDVVGDKPIGDISGDDMLDFRQWWLERLETDGLTPNSANKDIIHLGDVLKTVNRMKRLGLVLPLSDLSFKEGEAKQRPPFSTDWIRDRLLGAGALDGLNNEARSVVLAMVNTGARPSELAALTRDQIRLQAAVPHISLEPVGRQMKSRNARRVIPLTGVSLKAMAQNPDGFPQYLNSSATLSGTVNKYLRANGLLETPEHSLYGLRHSFEDRMLAAGIDERIRRDLLGHALGRERYGDGGSLANVQKLLQRLAL
jgi:integrase